MEVGEAKLNTHTEASERTVAEILESEEFVLGFEGFANMFSIYDSLAAKVKNRMAENNPEEDSKDMSFTEITDGLKTTMAQAKLERVNNRYSDDERVIRSSMRSLSAYLEIGDSELLKEEFFSEAKKLKGSISHLMSGLLGQLVGGDILLTIKDVVEV